MKRLVATLASTVMLACATPTLPGTQVTIIGKSFGLYYVSGSYPTHLETTLSIPRELGVSSGAEMLSQLPAHHGIPVPIAGEWRMPPVEGGRSSVEPFVPEYPKVEEGLRELPIAAGITFDVPEDLVPGSYVMLLYDPQTRRTYYRRTFTVDDCL